MNCVTSKKNSKSGYIITFFSLSNFEIAYEPSGYNKQAVTFAGGTIFTFCAHLKQLEKF